MRIFLKRSFALLIIMSMLNPFLTTLSLAYDGTYAKTDTDGDKEWVEGQLIVKFRPDIPRDDINEFIIRKDCETLDSSEKMSIYKLRLPSYLPVEEAVGLFLKDDKVVFAEPNYLYHTNSRAKHFLYKKFRRLFEFNLPTSGYALSLKEPLYLRLLIEQRKASRYLFAPKSTLLRSAAKKPVDSGSMDVFFSPFFPMPPMVPPIGHSPMPIIPLPLPAPAPFVPIIPRIIVPPLPHFNPALPVPLPAPAPFVPIIPRIIVPPPLPHFNPALPVPILPPVIPIIKPALPPPMPINPVLPLPIPVVPILPPPEFPSLPPVIEPVLPPQIYLNIIGALDAPPASPDIVIGIIDTGIDINNQDLAPYMWHNEDEIPSNGIDDDNNGYIDDFMGWDFFENDNNPQDTFSHGTHVAGIARNVGGNSRIMTVRAGQGPQLENMDIYKAIIYAVDNGANVLNLSFGSRNPSSAIKEAIDYAIGHGVVVVAAAGNYNTEELVYPANYKGVISVAALDSIGEKASFSSYGTWVDIAAPGVNILSNAIGRGFSVKSGTSMASPMVAGLAARILSVNSGLSPSQVAKIIMDTADSVDYANPWYGGLLGSGLIDAKEAVEVAKTVVPENNNNLVKQNVFLNRIEPMAGSTPADNDADSLSKNEDDEDGDADPLDKAIEQEEKPRPRSFLHGRKKDRGRIDPGLIKIINAQHELAFGSINDLPPGIGIEPNYMESGENITAPMP